MKPGIMTAEEFDARFSQFYKSTVDLIRKDERSQLLKSLVEEVEGMNTKRVRYFSDAPLAYEQALQDVIKVIKSKE
jgi:hypothetical protein